MENKRFCAMLDMSRNAVMKPEQVKKFIDILHSFGYNSLCLYMEDVYEIEEEPYFGYMRGRYTQKEIKDIVSYCANKNIEVFPCIETLAHLENIFNWNEYRPLRDIGDTLNVGDERIYKLIENMIKTVKKCFTSPFVNIAMDEAVYIGRGKYLSQFGYKDSAELFNQHLKRVVEIVKKYNLIPIVCSDMFFRTENKGGYYKPVNPPVNRSGCDDLIMFYWDYEHSKVEDYDQMFKWHEHLAPIDKVWFAGSAWSFIGFTPANALSLATLRPAMQSCRKNGVNNVVITLWGNGGAECSYYSLLPSLFFAKMIYDGVEDTSVIKQKFKELVGVDFELMQDLDSPNLICGNLDTCRNPSKYVLYSDLFHAYVAPSLPDGGSKEYARIAKRLKQGLDTPFGYVFEFLYRLCRALEVKYGLDMLIRKSYENKDIAALKECVKKISLCQKRIKEFHTAFKTRWYTENKPYGFEIHDYRLGGLITRMENCKTRIKQYIDGEIDTIPELEEKLLPYMEYHSGKEVEFTCITDIKAVMSANVFK